ncbi:hypothetical protein D3C86_1930210 [compost metagenome]
MKGSAPRSRAASTRLAGIERSRVRTMMTTKGTAWTVCARMIAKVPVGMSTVRMKMRMEMALISPGTTAGRQASAKMTALPHMFSAETSSAIQTPMIVAEIVVASAMPIE